MRLDLYMLIQKSKPRGMTEMKSAAELWAEEEARVVIAKEKAVVEAKAAAKAKAEEEIWNAAAIERAQAKAETAAVARAAEDARIAAAATDEWFYLLKGEQIGPVSLVGLKEKIADLSIEPPLKMVWTAGMDGWKPVYEVRKLCEPLASSEAELARSSHPVEEVVESETVDEAQLQAAVAAKAAEAAWLAAAAQSEAKARAQDAEEARMAIAQKARAKVEEETQFKNAAAAKLKAAEEHAKTEKEASFRAVAAANAAEQATLLAAAEAKAAAEMKLRAAAEAKSVEDAKLRAAAEAKAAEEARVAAAAKAETEAKARVRAEEEATLRAISAAKTAEEAKLRAAAEAKAAEEARAIAAARAKVTAEEEARAKAATAAKLQAAEEGRAHAEAKAAEEAKLRVAAEVKANQEAKLRAAAEAKAAVEAKTAAAAKTKAKKEIRAKTAENAKIRVLARAQASGKVSPVEVKGGEKGAISAKNCWFYTCEGERLGPVSFEELRAMTAHSSLDPRRDMIWKQGMDAWKPAGQIDGLFERTQVAVERNDAAALSSHPPQPSSRKVLPPNAPWPGARRRSFLLVSLVLPVVWHYAQEAASPFLIKQFGAILMEKILPYTAFAPLGVLLHFGLKRLVNLGMSRWWCLAVFAPILNLWLGYRCFACPPGYAYHQKLDGWGIALAMSYWLIMLALVLVLAACVALLCGGIESPLLLRQLHSLLRTN